MLHAQLLWHKSYEPLKDSDGRGGAHVIRTVIVLLLMSSELVLLTLILQKNRQSRRFRTDEGCRPQASGSVPTALVNEQCNDAAIDDRHYCERLLVCGLRACHLVSTVCHTEASAEMLSKDLPCPALSSRPRS